MKKLHFKSIKALDEKVKFLENNLSEDMYSVVLTKDGADLSLTDEAVTYLKRMDHDCTTGPEDGCGFCNHLLELDLIPDYDLSDLEDYTTDEDDKHTDEFFSRKFDLIGGDK